MNERHTPGPWLWAKHGQDWSLHSSVGPRACVLAARSDPREEWPSHQILMVRHDAPGGSLLVPFDPTHPDARLIAAAPLLLQEATPAAGLMQHAASLLEVYRETMPYQVRDLVVRLAWQTGRLQSMCLRATEGGER